MQLEGDDQIIKEIKKKEFELYQANDKDQTYMGNWNNFKDWSISLIISQKSLEQVEIAQNMR